MKVIDKFLDELILAIESTPAQLIAKRTEEETFELWSNPAILENLSGNIGAIFVRALLNKLGTNEHHIFKWRLENKFRQYQILNHYLPGCVAESLGLSELLNKANGVQKINELCQNGFFLKATLGHRTGESNSFDRTAELQHILQSHPQENDPIEKWMLQKRLNLTEEFRIHTFNRDLIYGLTFIMSGSDSSLSTHAEEFVNSILEKLPDTILQGTLIGWDIGITENNEYYVIEGNFTGFHPEFERGFQTSGYFGDLELGAIMCAWLNNFFRVNYQVSIASIESSLYASNPFYKQFSYYASLFKNTGLEYPRIKAKDTPVAAIVYLGDEINPLLINLLEYFQEENFADIYYLIVNAQNIPALRTMFLRAINLRFIPEDKLFTADKYQRIKQSGYERQRAASNDQTAGLIPEKSVFIV